MFQQQPDVCTVSEVTTHLKELLESSSFLSDLWIVGEVSNLRISPAGHAYFTLKDNNSSLNCVLFRGQSGAEILENGKSVLTHGRMSFYEPRGSTDFMVDRVLPEGEGELARELERLKAQLELEGLFEESRKRPLPLYPQVIGGGHLSYRGGIPGHPKRHTPPLSPGHPAPVPHSGSRAGRRSVHRRRH